METDTTVTTSIDANAGIDAEVNTSEVDVEYSLDDLMNLTDEQYEEFSEEANHKGMRPLNELIKHLPSDARKHLANMRSSYTKKTQELSSERDRLMAELNRERESILAERASLYNGDLASRTKQLAASEDEFDIYDPEGMKAEIQRQAAKMLQEMIQPAQENLALEQRKIELNRFKAENPEITSNEYRLPIATLLRDRPELKLEDAFYIVKAKVDSNKVSQQRAELEAERNRRKETFNKTSQGSNASPNGKPKGDAWAMYQFHKSQLNKK